MTTNQEFDDGDANPANPAIAQLHNLWTKQFDEARAAHHGQVSEMEIAESMLTVAVFKMYGVSNAAGVAARLQFVAGAICAHGVQSKDTLPPKPPAPPTAH